MHSRHITPLIKEALSDTPVVLLNGARQTGKSTLAQTLNEAQPRRYLTLDDQVTLAAATSDPDGFISGLTGSVALDEVQRAPALFLAIKAAVDRDRQAGRFLLTGSANVMLLPNISESLAGRMEVLSLFPLSSAEINDSAELNLADSLFDGDLNALHVKPCERAELVEFLIAGGYPEAIERKVHRRRKGWFDNYLQAILYRDVRELANVEQLSELPNLLSLIAHRSGNLLNLAELSRTSDLTQTTLKRYFTLLETLFLVHRLPAWARNPSKRLVKAPKVFIPDSGLMANLAGWSEDRLAPGVGLSGGLVETYVLSELLKHLAFSYKSLTLWHYRTQSNIEVDFILENRAGLLTGIEVKASSTVEAKDFKGLRHLQETEAKVFQRGIVLYSGREVIPFGEKLFAVPLSVWWSNKHSPV